MNVPAVTISRYGGRYRQVTVNGELLCVCLYLKGARAVVAALRGQLPEPQPPSAEGATRPQGSTTIPAFLLKQEVNPNE
jgi:hypothetical protein